MDPSHSSANGTSSVEPVDPNSPLVIEVNIDEDSPPVSPRRRRNAEASPRRSAIRRLFDCRNDTYDEICRKVIVIAGIVMVLMLAGYGIYHIIELLVNYYKKD